MKYPPQELRRQSNCFENVNFLIVLSAVAHTLRHDTRTVGVSRLDASQSAASRAIEQLLALNILNAVIYRFVVRTVRVVVNGL